MATTVNVIEFKGHLKAFQGLTERQAVAGQKKITFQLLRGVIMGNPVKTGRSKGGWTVSVGAPSGAQTGILNASEEGTIGVSGAIGAAGTSLRSLKFGQPSFVENNVEYVGHLEKFHPRKSGWVAATVARVEAQFQVGGG